MANLGNRNKSFIMLRRVSRGRCLTVMRSIFRPSISLGVCKVAMANINDSAAYSGAALALRDRLIIEWNKTQQRQSFADQKRVYCRSFFYFPMFKCMCG